MSGHTPTIDDLWLYVWKALAEYGACDAWGGVEQLRITAEWVAAGRPVGVAEFIIGRANEIPPSVVLPTAEG